MKNYRIALKLKEDSYDRLLLIEKIRAECSCDVFDLFKIIDSYDFYYYALNKAERVDEKWYLRIIYLLNLRIENFTN